MRSIRTSAIALVTAGAVALSATPAMAQDGSTFNPNATISSEIGNALGASDSEKAIWGSSKGGNDATTFGWIWYGYTLAVTAAAIAGGVNAAYPEIQKVAAQWGIQL